MKKALLVIAQNGYQDIELSRTRDMLIQSEFEIVIASTQQGECSGKLGGTEQAEIALRDVVVRDYDCIAFIGGPGAAGLASDTEALRIAHETVRADLPLGAICIAPIILAKARVLKGKKATAWDGNGEQSTLIEKYGATFTGDSVTVDGKVVTANGPDAAQEFGRALAAL